MGIITARLRSDSRLQLHREGRQEAFNFIIFIIGPLIDSFIIEDISLIGLELVALRYRPQQAGPCCSPGLLQLLRPDSRCQASLEPSMNNFSSSPARLLRSSLMYHLPTTPISTRHHGQVEQKQLNKAPEPQHGSHVLPLHSGFFQRSHINSHYRHGFATTHTVLKSLWS